MMHHRFRFPKVHYSWWLHSIPLISIGKFVLPVAQVNKRFYRCDTDCASAIRPSALQLFFHVLSGGDRNLVYFGSVAINC